MAKKKKVDSEVTETEEPTNKIAVLDENGEVLYYKRNKTDLDPEGKPIRGLAPTKPRKRIEHSGTMKHNRAMLEFPTDRWGLTGAVKKEVINMASRIAGDPLKYKLAQEVMAVLQEHLELKFEVDQQYRERVLANKLKQAEKDDLMEEVVDAS